MLNYATANDIIVFVFEGLNIELFYAFAFNETD